LDFPVFCLDFAILCLDFTGFEYFGSTIQTKTFFWYDFPDFYLDFTYRSNIIFNDEKKRKADKLIYLFFSFWTVWLCLFILFTHIISKN
jgi:hypothetical protein